MKLLKLTAEGLPLFKDKLELTFFAKQRVGESDAMRLHYLFSNIYLNTSTAFIGINASGKTSILKVILLSLKLLNNEPINYISSKDILGESDRTVLNLYFYSAISQEVCRLETIICSNKDSTKGITYKIFSEKLWSKKINEISSKKTLLNFNDKDPVMIRDGKQSFLLDDVSIMISYNKENEESIKIFDILDYTNVNILTKLDTIPMEIVTYLDPTIEKIYFDSADNNALIHLKFKGKEEMILNSALDLNNYLSSGTVKGIITFTLVQQVLLTGGYLVIDVIENHFNKEIVSTIIRLFLDCKLNKNGGCLIFTTHYPELLDEYDRNDSIYFVRNRQGIIASNLSDILNRNDLKRSEVYQSGYLEGTVPMYDSYIKLKKSIAQATE